MATYEGSAGSVKIESGEGTLTTVAGVRSWSIDITRDTVEDTSMSSNGVRTYKKGLQTFSGSMDVVYDDTSDAETSEALDPGNDNAVTMELFPDASVSGTKFAGPIIVTSHSVTASYDGLVEASISFQGNGALTTTKYGQGPGA